MKESAAEEEDAHTHTHTRRHSRALEDADDASAPSVENAVDDAETRGEQVRRRDRSSTNSSPSTLTRILREARTHRSHGDVAGHAVRARLCAWLAASLITRSAAIIVCYCFSPLPEYQARGNPRKKLDRASHAGKRVC